MIKKFSLFLIRCYISIKRIYFSDKIGVCKFYPSCSNYAYQAIEKYGVLKGTYLSIKRIIRCNPFSKGGYDPLK